MERRIERKGKLQARLVGKKRYTYVICGDGMIENIAGWKQWVTMIQIYDERK